LIIIILAAVSHLCLWAEGGEDQAIIHHPSFIINHKNDSIIAVGKLANHPATDDSILITAHRRG
jgi:hypothetical protein